MTPGLLTVAAAFISVVISLIAYAYRFGDIVPGALFVIAASFALEQLMWFLDIDNGEHWVRPMRRCGQLTMTAFLPISFWHNAVYNSVEPFVWPATIATIGTLCCVILWVDYLRLLQGALSDLFNMMRWNR